MIRHRPEGSGHPYATTGDQRVPVVPYAGEPVELRVRAAPAVTRVVCDWREDGGPALTFDLAPVAAQDTRDQGGGHLAAAQARARRAGGAWSAWTPPLERGRRYAYRFRASTDGGRARTGRWHTVTAAAWAETGGTLTVKGRDRVVPGSVRWLADGDAARRVRFALALAPDEHVVGFGERYAAVDQRGRRLDAVVFEQYKAQGDRTYLPMPYALVVGGETAWGLHVATSTRTWYDVGATRPDRLVVEAELREPALTVAFPEGSPAEVLDAFLAEVGRPAELPEWVFRLWASGNEWNTQARVMAEMDRHRAEDVPAGVVVIEAWSDESTFTAFRGAEYAVSEEPRRLADFTFPADGPWPDPKGMVDELHARGIRVLLWQIPLQKMRPHPSGQAALDARLLVERGHAVRRGDGRPYRNRGWWFPLALMPDLSSPETRRWWTERRRYLVEDVGIDGFKTDGGEHAWGSDLRYADGRRGVDGNSLFPVHYARAFGDLLRSAGRPPVTFSRAGFAGSQPHGAFWAGDEDSTWEAFAASIRAGITASACGIVYWGWDLAGFSGEVPDAELYLRAAGTSCFMPIMQYHSEFNHHRLPRRDRTPWNVAERTGDPRVLPVFRRFAHLRERLVPYLAGEARAAVAGGAPLMRGLFFDFPRDRAIWRHPLQYLLGDALLVLPVVTPGVSEVAGYLPGGPWTDVWTGAEHAGGREVTLPAPIDRPPVLCRTDRWAGLAPVFACLPELDT
ncbi:TIM-barrel domain-containing protein [Bailinhaonella thermotolerans]|uniref:Glycoside hydrolase family 31 n=1 Tax=Bailinhaonella thermotolerans TaxID=1070861 RepID=A0A3A4B3J2_9ACTN|nr:TIM-barrel domain-containing protein [Bailinhaonella thermotolerans]RJL32599.1 glycoside hydrolase family 31 [Bailinhaonella thermotolerans]